MIAYINGRGQMVIPAEARKEAGIGQGDVVSVEPDGDGRIVLVRLQKARRRPATKARITYRKGTHAVGSTGQIISSERIRALLADFA
jgi:AbrB family looped-hinge helix DNA binding protein